MRAARSEVECLKSHVQQHAQQNSVDAAKLKTLDAEEAEAVRQAELDGVEIPRAADGSVDLSAVPDGQELADLEQQRAALARQIALAQAELDQLCPNLKSLEKFGALEAKVGETSAQADAARKLCAEAEAKFQDVKTRRRDKFMACYKDLSRSIDAIYKEMTTYGDEEGGSAYLDVDDEEEPYLKGVQYTTMVPRKRFRELHLQSGGERTLAALALLFALHAVQQPPFMILDEVDAALDAQNVTALVAYLQKAAFQSIVISLKDKLYSECEALVGVYRPPVRDASAVLTLDLSPWSA